MNVNTYMYPSVQLVKDQYLGNKYIVLNWTRASSQRSNILNIVLIKNFGTFHESNYSRN